VKKKRKKKENLLAQTKSKK